MLTESGGTNDGSVVYCCSSAAVRPLQAQRLYNAVTSRTGLFGNRSSKIKYHGYYVISKTTTPALLTKNGLIDFKTDVQIILSATHAERTTQGIVDFLAAELRLKAVQEGPWQPQTSELIVAGNSQTASVYYPAYTGTKTTFSVAITALGMNVSYAHRKLIAKANGIIGYVGTVAQNTKIYNLLAAGILKKE